MFYQAEILRASANMEFFNGSRRQAQMVQAHRPEMRKNRRNFASFVALVAAFILTKSVHTA
jgi:hypothetical protein